MSEYDVLHENGVFYIIRRDYGEGDRYYIKDGPTFTREADAVAYRDMMNATA